MALPTAEDRVKKFEEQGIKFAGVLPRRVWVEGDGRMYGDFWGNEGEKKRITELDAIKLIYEAEKYAQIFSSI